MNDRPIITSPDDPALDALVRPVGTPGRRTGPHRERGPRSNCGCAARPACFLVHAAHWGGLEWSEPDITRGYLRLGAACLTTAFIITQRTGACQRIAGSDNDAAKERLLPDLVSGESFATVGISHLTTSRRHLGQPVLRAREVDDGFVLDGYSPWVTGADHARSIVTGADAGRRPADSGGACRPICRASPCRRRRDWSACRPATPAKCT